MNLPTVIALALVAAAFGAVVIREIKKKRAGKASCGGNCGSCSCGCGK